MKIVQAFFVVIIIVLTCLMFTGCTSDSFLHQSFGAEGNLLSNTQISHATAGGKEYKGIQGKGPGGWEFSLEGSSQQDIEVETLAAKIAAILAGSE